jgi:hypothetical protein
MKNVSLPMKAVAGLALGFLLSGTALASFNPVLRTNMDRFDPTANSNSGHTVVAECGGAFDGSDHPGQRPAKARLKTYQSGDMTWVRIVLRNGKPNTLYTVWLRVKGNDQDGNAFGGSPLSGGGATPLAAGSALNQLTADWIGAGSANPANGFMTNGNGRGVFSTTLNFPLHGGAYPFNEISAASLTDIRVNKNAAALATPTAIVDPDNAGVSGPFMIRVVSHCQDGLGHGLSRANRETWFDFH